MNADGARSSHQNEQRLITRAVHARAQRRAREAQLAEARAAVEKFARGTGEPLPVHVVQQNDLTRRQVLVYTIVGQAVVQIAVQVLRIVL